jgi:hypothetical protein
LNRNSSDVCASGITRSFSSACGRITGAAKNGDRFRLNKNFGIGERELVFLFNTYEIGPGAMGATEIRMPYQQIHNLFKPDLHLW